MSTSTAFTHVKAAGESLRNAEFHLGLLPEKPAEHDPEAVRTHLTDVRIALGHVAVALSDLHAQQNPTPPIYMTRIEAGL